MCLRERLAVATCRGCSGRADAVHIEEEPGKRGADRDLCLGMKCVNNSCSQRDRVLNAAIDNRRLLCMELERDERPAYLKLEIRWRESKPPETYVAEAGADCSGK